MWKSDPTPGNDDLNNLEKTRPKDAFTQVIAFCANGFGGGLKNVNKCSMI